MANLSRLNTDQKALQKFEQAIGCLPIRIKEKLSYIPTEVKIDCQEIRIRINKPIILHTYKSAYFVDDENSMISEQWNDRTLVASKFDVNEIFKAICGYSVHSHQNEIKNGFVTIKGGHRVGICGTAVVENGVVTTMKEISSINIRIAKEFENVSCDLVRACSKNGEFKSIIIAGAPNSGKTTILRDIALQLSNCSNGVQTKVCIIDERGEIAAMYLGEAQNSFGASCDILDGFPKAEGILAAVRTMSPNVIICDEIGSVEETKAIESGLNSGVSFVISIHASDINELLHKPQIKQLLATNAFPNIVILSAGKDIGKISNIYKVSDLIDKNGGTYLHGKRLYGFGPNTITETQ